MLNGRENFPAFNIPIILMPATIKDNLPGTELWVGQYTALNSIVDAMNKIKQSAVASERCFVVEVMGKYCGYLALMSMIATGAERAYLNERGITLDDLREDVRLLNTGYAEGKRLGVMIRNEQAHPIYTTDFIARLFAAEGGDLYEVRTVVLGHLQQGGDPTPFDRIMATRDVYRRIQYLEEKVFAGESEVACVGITGSEYGITPLTVCAARVLTSWRSAPSSSGGSPWSRLRACWRSQGRVSTAKPYEIDFRWVVVASPPGDIMGALCYRCASMICQACAMERCLHESATTLARVAHSRWGLVR